MKYGVDLSHWNGEIDFSKVDKDFVIMKVSQGVHKDSKFDEYYNKCHLPKGVYIYNKVKSVADAVEEANFAVKCLKGKTLEYGVWLDMEDASMRKLGKALLTNIINTEASILHNAGYRVGIYCNNDWYKNVLDSATLSKVYPFWVARYPFGDNGTVKESLSPKALNNCKIWQYSSKGTVKGIKGNVDLNIEYESPFGATIPTIKDKTVDELALEVLEGVYGSGEIRKQRLGNRYAEVQKRVNELLNG